MATAVKTDKLAALLYGTMKTLGISFEDIAEPGMSANTLRSRFKNPDRLTRGELHKLSRKLHIPIEEIRAVM